MLFLGGVRLWPGIVIGDLLLGDFSTPLATVVAQTVGNTLALVVAALVLRRLTGGRGELERVADVVALLACALLAAVISGAVGPLALRLGGVIEADELGRVFRTWILGDASGVLVVAPALLTWATRGLQGIRRREVFEGTVALVVLVVLAELPPQRDVPYIVFPVLLWAALRFGPRGAATAILVVCSITVWNTAQSDGPFVRDSLTDSLLATQLFIAISADHGAAPGRGDRRACARGAGVGGRRGGAARARRRAGGTAPDRHACRRRAVAQPRLRAGDRRGRPPAGIARCERHALRRGAHGNGRGRVERGRPAAFPGRHQARPRWRHRVAKVVRSGSAQRVERYEEVSGTLAATVRGVGYRAAVAAPVSVAGRLWGVLAAATHVRGRVARRS